MFNNTNYTEEIKMTKYIFLTIIMYLISTNCNAEAKF